MSFTDPSFLSTFWLPTAMMAVMSCTFLYTMISPSETSRKHTLLVWVIVIIGIAQMFYGYQILAGKIAEFNCTDEKVAERNDASAALTAASGYDMGGAIT